MLVPEVIGEVGADACKDRKKVILERLDGTFRNVATVDVGWNQLVGAVPFFCDDTAVFGTCLGVEYLMIDGVAEVFKALHDAVVCWNPVPVVTGLERLNKNGIRVAVVSQHDVLVTTARSYREPTHVVSEELADRLDPDVELAGGSWRYGSGRDLGLFELGGADALPDLCHVSLDCFISIRAVLGCIGVGEAWPTGVVAGFYGC